MIPVMARPISNLQVAFRRCLTTPAYRALPSVAAEIASPTEENEPAAEHLNESRTAMRVQTVSLGALAPTRHWRTRSPPLEEPLSNSIPGVRPAPATIVRCSFQCYRRGGSRSPLAPLEEP